jgi:leucyl/phenylalanyl-tRNA--protein transferase
MSTSLPWLEPEDPFPPAALAWGPGSPAPGLLAAGAALDTAHLHSAYGQGIFPWFSEGQPILWWAPDPRMVLVPAQFRLHRSLRKTLQKFRDNAQCEIRIDHDFGAVIQACASKPRPGQNGTWIVPDMVRAYRAFHAAGYAHSVETWVDGKLVGGLYCIGLGHAVFGESMFAHAPDASKIALSALVCLCRSQGVALIDCQQNTRHLASLGAHEMPRADFLRHIAQARQQAPLRWAFEPSCWNALVPPKDPAA